jgi:D-3-phosphoglycerate dehydrogenase
MRPHLVLVEQMGRLLGQLAEGAAERLEIIYSGAVAELNTALLTLAMAKGFLMPQLSENVNLVNAKTIASRRGIELLEEKTSKAEEGFSSLVTARVTTKAGRWAVSGTLFGEGPRIVSIDGYRVDFEPFGYMLIDNHVDRPGILGSHNINIAGMQLGRATRGGVAVTVLSVDDFVPNEVLDKIREVDGVQNLKQVDLGGKDRGEQDHGEGE